MLGGVTYKSMSMLLRPCDTNTLTHPSYLVYITELGFSSIWPRHLTAGSFLKIHRYHKHNILQFLGSALCAYLFLILV